MLVLNNCRIFDGVSPDLQEARSIVIEDGIIRDVVSASDTLSGEHDVIDMRGDFVMPGLIDAHYHAYGMDMNPQVIERTSPQLRILHSKIMLEKSLRRGFTTIRDAGGGDVNLAQALQTGLIDGPRFFYPGLALSQTGGHGDFRGANYHGPSYHGMCGCAYCGVFSMVVDGADAVRQAARDQLRQGATQIKICVSGGVMSPTNPYWMNQLTDAEITAAVEEASTRRTYVMAHAHTNEAALRCIKNGVRSIEHASILTSDGAKAIAEAGAYAVPTLIVVEVALTLGPGMGIPAALLEKAEQVGKHGMASLDLLRSAGAQIGYGTDLLGSTLDRQLREFRLRSQVCSPIELLRSATSVNAALLQMEGRLGTIAPGAFADILAIDGNPLDDIFIMEQEERFTMVMRDGKIVKSNYA